MQASGFFVAYLINAKGFSSKSYKNKKKFDDAKNLFTFIQQG